MSGTVSRIVVAAGAVGAVALMLVAGHAGTSRVPFLLVLFAFWVISPFVALGWAHSASTRWSPPTRTALSLVTIVTTLGTLLAYGVVALGPPRGKVAPVFVVAPPLSWLLLAIAVPLAARLGAPKSR